MGTSTTGLDFSFGVGHREMVVDWGYRATHLMTVVAKAIAKAYYTRDPQQSYFMGCSTGGHQAITEARRYPDDYNGIVAGDPANNRVRLHMNGYWAYEATHDDPASYIPPSKLPMINKAVLERLRQDRRPRPTASSTIRASARSIWRACSAQAPTPPTASPRRR